MDLKDLELLLTVFLDDAERQRAKRLLAEDIARLGRA